jgi:hypothetical protein
MQEARVEKSSSPTKPITKNGESVDEDHKQSFAWTEKSKRDTLKRCTLSVGHIEMAMVVRESPGGNQMVPQGFKIKSEQKARCKNE